MTIDTVITSYFDIFTKEYFLLIMGIGICTLLVYTIYNNFTSK